MQDLVTDVSVMEMHNLGSTVSSTISYQDARLSQSDKAYDADEVKKEVYESNSKADVKPVRKVKSSMRYIETIRERKIRKGSGGGILDKIADLNESLYWMYYIHLPFYLMTSFDSFCLHAFFLTIFSLSFFGVIKYFLL